MAPGGPIKRLNGATERRVDSADTILKKKSIIRAVGAFVLARAGDWSVPCGRNT
jgi:hypothetical protein